MSEDTQADQPEIEDFVYKTEFAMKHGISPRTVDLWVKAGKVERTVSTLDRRALFRLVTPSSPVTPSDTPEWAREMLDELRALRAEVAALRGAQAVTAQLGSGGDQVTQIARPETAEVATDSNPVTTPARIPWWRRIFLLE